MKPLLSLFIFFTTMPVSAAIAWNCKAEVDGKNQALQSIETGYQFRIKKSESTFIINFKSNDIELSYQSAPSKSKNQSTQLLSCELDGVNCSGKFFSLYNGQATQRKLINEVNSRATVVKDGSKEVFKFLKTSQNLEITFLQDTSFSNLTYRCDR